MGPADTQLSWTKSASSLPEVNQRYEALQQSKSHADFLAVKSRRKANQRSSIISSLQASANTKQGTSERHAQHSSNHDDERYSRKRDSRKRYDSSTSPARGNRSKHSIVTKKLPVRRVRAIKRAPYLNLHPSVLSVLSGLTSLSKTSASTNSTMTQTKYDREVVQARTSAHVASTPNPSARSTIAPSEHQQTLEQHPVSISDGRVYDHRRPNPTLPPTTTSSGRWIHGRYVPQHAPADVAYCTTDRYARASQASQSFGHMPLDYRVRSDLDRPYQTPSQEQWGLLPYPPAFDHSHATHRPAWGQMQRPITPSQEQSYRRPSVGSGPLDQSGRNYRASDDKFIGAQSIDSAIAYDLVEGNGDKKQRPSETGDEKHDKLDCDPSPTGSRKHSDTAPLQATSGATDPDMAQDQAAPTSPTDAIVVFRRFMSLHTRVLTQIQSDLATYEAQLLDLEDRIRTYPGPDMAYLQALQDRRRHILSRVFEKLEQYNHALEVCESSSALRSPTQGELLSLRRSTQSQKGLLHHEDDLFRLPSHPNSEVQEGTIASSESPTLPSDDEVTTRPAASEVTTQAENDEDGLKQAIHIPEISLNMVEACFIICFLGFFLSIVDSWNKFSLATIFIVLSWLIASLLVLSIQCRSYLKQTTVLCQSGEYSFWLFARSMVFLGTLIAISFTIGVIFDPVVLTILPLVVCSVSASIITSLYEAQAKSEGRLDAGKAPVTAAKVGLYASASGESGTVAMNDDNQSTGTHANEVKNVHT